MAEFDLSKAQLKDKPKFTPYKVPNRGESLRDSKLPPTQELMLIERGGTVKAFLVKQMAYHHVAQGDINGEPYLISF